MHLDRDHRSPANPRDNVRVTMGCHGYSKFLSKDKIYIFTIVVTNVRYTCLLTTMKLCRLNINWYMRNTCNFSVKCNKKIKLYNLLSWIRYEISLEISLHYFRNEKYNIFRAKHVKDKLPFIPETWRNIKLLWQAISYSFLGLLKANKCLKFANANPAVSLEI